MKLLLFLLALSSSKAITFHCNFHMMEFHNLPSKYFCEVFSFSNEEHQVTTHVSGFHSMSKRNLDVEGFYINLKGKNFTYIPKGLEIFFPNLIAIHVDGGNITKLNGDELTQFANLEWFALIKNNLEFVPGNLFAHNKKLRTIFLYDNKIKKIGAGLLDELEDLQSFCFNRNICAEEWPETEADVKVFKKTLKEKCEEN